jgi:hypothetical protein
MLTFERFRYDWADFIRTTPYYGVYGPGFGSWYIVPGKDDYNGDQLKQELMVHRESSTGDVVQLNMLHGTHYMASSSDAFPVGKTWGPWLWYLVSAKQSILAIETDNRRMMATQMMHLVAQYGKMGSIHIPGSRMRPTSLEVLCLAR